MADMRFTIRSNSVKRYGGLDWFGFKVQRVYIQNTRIIING